MNTRKSENNFVNHYDLYRGQHFSFIRFGALWPAPMLSYNTRPRLKSVFFNSDVYSFESDRSQRTIYLIAANLLGLLIL
jgi:hypothetical protein